MRLPVAAVVFSCGATMDDLQDTRIAAELSKREAIDSRMRIKLMFHSLMTMRTANERRR